MSSLVTSEHLQVDGHSAIHFVHLKIFFRPTSTELSRVMWPYIAATIVVGSQLLTVTTEDFGGLSGQDSIVAAFVGSFDSSTGILFFLAAINFLFDGTSWRIFDLPRWRLLHSKKEDTHKQISVNYRSSPWPLAEKVHRIGRLYRKNMSEENSEFDTWTPVAFANNLSIFLVPFLKEKRPLDNGSPRQITLSGPVLWRAIATSLARLLCFITIVLALFVIRIVVYTTRTSNWQVSLTIVLAELLRTITATAQEISIFTYSCAYKGTRTWAWPAKSNTVNDQPTSTSQTQPHPWTSEQQEDFEKLVSDKMNLVNPGRILFWTMKLCQRLHVTKPLFHAWATPRFEHFTGQTLDELLLEVVQPDLQTGEYEPVCKVHFRNVPEEIVAALDLHLFAVPTERNIGWLYMVSSALNIFLPVLFIGLHPNEMAKVYYTLEQLLVAKALRFYDPVDFSVNTKFKTVVGPYEGV